MGTCPRTLTWHRLLIRGEVGGGAPLMGRRCPQDGAPGSRPAKPPGPGVPAGSASCPNRIPAQTQGS